MSSQNNPNINYGSNNEYDESQETRLRTVIRIALGIDLILALSGFGYRIAFGYLLSEQETEKPKRDETKYELGIFYICLAVAVLLFKITTFIGFYWVTNKFNCDVKTHKCLSFTNKCSIFNLLMQIGPAFALVILSDHLEVKKMGSVQWMGAVLGLYDLIFCVALVVLACKFKTTLQTKIDLMRTTLEHHESRWAPHQREHWRQELQEKPTILQSEGMDLCN